jgi:hypothetical protein
MKTKQNLSSGLKNRTAKLSEENPPRQIDFAQRRLNRDLSTERVLHMLRTRAPQFWEIAEVVGDWIWIQFEGKQPKQVTAALAEFGFHWNGRRQLWQHPCGQYIESASYDPRRRYGSYFPAHQEAA